MKCSIINLIIFFVCYCTAGISQSESEFLGTVKVVHTQGETQFNLLGLERSNSPISFVAQNYPCGNSTLTVPASTNIWSVELSERKDPLCPSAGFPPTVPSTPGFGGHNDLIINYNSDTKGTFSYSTGEYIQGSDIRLKENITYLAEPVIDKLMEISPVFYNYKSSPNANKSLGFIAQDVKEEFPELVNNFDGEYIGLNYGVFGVLAIKGIQEQQEMITILQQRNAQLEQKLNSIEAEMKNIRKALQN